MSKRKFCAALIVLALCSFTIGAIELIQYIDFKDNARTANATLATDDPKPKDTMVISGMQLHQYPLTFTSDRGAEIYVTPYVPAHLKDRLLDGKTIEITYLSNDRKRITFSPGEISNGTIWFAPGAVFSIVSILALRLFRAEKT